MEEEKRQECLLEMMRVLADAKVELKDIWQYFYLCIDDGKEEHFLHGRRNSREDRLSIDLYLSRGNFFDAFICAKLKLGDNWEKEIDDMIIPHLCLTFGGKDRPSLEQKAAYRSVQKERGKQVSGKNAYPFVTYYPGHCDPTAELTQEQMKLITHDLGIVLDVQRKNHELFDHVGLGGTYFHVQKGKDGYSVARTAFPECSISMGHADLSKLDAKKLEAAMALPSEGTYISYMYPSERIVYLGEERKKVYPFILYLWQGLEGEMGNAGATKEHFRITLDPDGEKEAILEEVLDDFLADGSLPERMEFYSYDKYSQRLFTDLCQKLAIECGEESRGIWGLSQTFEEYISAYHRSGRLGWKEKYSFLIRASLRKDLYREIQISAEATYKDLADAIVTSVLFSKVHLFYFQVPDMPDKIQGEFFEPEHEDYMAAGKMCLIDSELKEGVSFVFLYDFGDQWRFSCEVLKVIPKETEGKWRIAKKAGRSPMQYD